jgi:hypothetical protein
MMREQIILCRLKWEGWQPFSHRKNNIEARGKSKETGFNSRLRHSLFEF